MSPAARVQGVEVVQASQSPVVLVEANQIVLVFTALLVRGMAPRTKFGLPALLTLALRAVPPAELAPVAGRVKFRLLLPKGVGERTVRGRGMGTGRRVRADWRGGVSVAVSVAGGCRWRAHGGGGVCGGSAASKLPGGGAPAPLAGAGPGGPR